MSGEDDLCESELLRGVLYFNSEGDRHRQTLRSMVEGEGANTDTNSLGLTKLLTPASLHFPNTSQYIYFIDPLSQKSHYSNAALPSFRP
jgi:hypothetical protein